MDGFVWIIKCWSEVLEMKRLFWINGWMDGWDEVDGWMDVWKKKYFGWWIFWKKKKKEEKKRIEHPK